MRRKWPNILYAALFHDIVHASIIRDLVNKIARDSIHKIYVKKDEKTWTRKANQRERKVIYRSFCTYRYVEHHSLSSEITNLWQMWQILIIAIKNN